MLNSVLAGAFDWNSIVTVVGFLPLVAMILGALVGFVKGVRRIAWGGVAWMVAVNVYAVLLGVLKGMLGDSFGESVPVVVAAVVCDAVSLLLFTLLRLVIYPREKKLDNKDMQDFLRREDRFRKVEQEELEELDDPNDEDELEKLERMQMRRRKRYLDKLDGRPGFLNRVLGAVIVALDFAFILGIVIDSIAVVINATPLASGVLAELCSLEAFQNIVKAADKNVLDYVLIGIVMCSVYAGYKRGILSTVYSLFALVASITSFGFGFFLPFSEMAVEGGALAFIGSMSANMSTMIAGFIPLELPEVVLDVVGKIASGLVLSIVFQIFMWIMLRLLRHAAELSADSAVFHIIDGVFGVLLGIVVCILVVVIGFFVLLYLEYIGWYAASVELFATTNLISVCYGELGVLMQPWIETVAGFLPF